MFDQLKEKLFSSSPTVGEKKFMMERFYSWVEFQCRASTDSEEPHRWGDWMELPSSPLSQQCKECGSEPIYWREEKDHWKSVEHDLPEQVSSGDGMLLCRNCGNPGHGASSANCPRV